MINRGKEKIVTAKRRRKSTNTKKTDRTVITNRRKREAARVKKDHNKEIDEITRKANAAEADSITRKIVTTKRIRRREIDLKRKSTAEKEIVLLKGKGKGREETFDCI